MRTPAPVWIGCALAAALPIAAAFYAPRPAAAADNDRQTIATEKAARALEEIARHLDTLTRCACK